MGLFDNTDHVTCKPLVLDGGYICLSGTWTGISDGEIKALWEVVEALTEQRERSLVAVQGNSLK